MSWHFLNLTGLYFDATLLLHNNARCGINCNYYRRKGLTDNNVALQWPYVQLMWPKFISNGFSLNSLWLFWTKLAESGISEMIGKTIFSANLGHGTVVDVTKMGEQEFYVIESDKGRVKNYIPIKDQHSFRVATSIEEVKKIVSTLSAKSKLVKIDSKKDRINYFKAQAKNQDLDLVATLLIDLQALDDRGLVEQQIYTKLIESLALEYSLAGDVTQEEANQIIRKSLKGENND